MLAIPTLPSRPSLHLLKTFYYTFPSLLTINSLTSGSPSHPLPAPLPPPNPTHLSITPLHPSPGAIFPVIVFGLLASAFAVTGSALPSTASIACIAKPTAFFALAGTPVFCSMSAKMAPGKADLNRL
jgi:hypothetical protein